MGAKTTTTTRLACDGCDLFEEFRGTLLLDDAIVGLELGVSRNWTAVVIIPINDPGRLARMERPRRVYCVECFEKVLTLLDGLEH